MVLSSMIGEVSQQLSAGSMTAAQLLEKCLTRAQLVSRLNAFISVCTESARIEAAHSDHRLRKGKRLGALDGVPVAVKDNFCIRGTVTSCGSRMLADFKPPYTATVVDRLQRAGAVILGKTNLDEFAMGVGTTNSYYGVTRNVWRSGLPYRLTSSTQSSLQVPTANPEPGDFFVPGGSSGGSAVAVASGCCFAALGSDTGGSVRNPAASCGLVGLKPSYGRFSRHGLVPLVNSMDVPAILARRVSDVVTVYNAINVSDSMDSTCLSDAVLPRTSLPIPTGDDNDDNWDGLDLSRLQIGIPREYRCDGVSSEVLDAWESTADLLSRAGASVRQVSLPHTHLSIACYSVLNCAEVASNMARYTGLQYGYRADSDADREDQERTDVAFSTEALFASSRCHALSQVVRGRILTGNYFMLKKNYDTYVTQAMRLRRLIRRDFDELWRSGFHLLLTPVTIGDGIRHSEFMSRDSRSNTAALDIFTQPANMAGIPALSLPVAVSSRGLPIGLQLMAPMFDEQLLFSAARWLERRLQFPQLEMLV